MYKKYGKHINTNKLQKGNPLKGKPSNQASGLPMRLTKKIKQLTNDIINLSREIEELSKQKAQYGNF